MVEAATKELKIEKKLQAIEEVWTSLTLDYVPHKESDVLVVHASDEVVEFLEAHQMELQTMIGMGRFVDYVRGRVMRWQQNLGNVEVVLKDWISVTRAWASLESIFLGSADIRSQLPDDTKRFEGIDQAFKDLMKEAVDAPNVVEACTKDGREEPLKEMAANLELCQKSLIAYLDMKKKIVPRFYFVSNVALLDILSNGNNPPKILPYVGDCYDLRKALRTKIISLITMDVHGRDTVQRIIDAKAEGPTDFIWQQQLRFYWSGETRAVDIRITDFKSKYSHEWVGNSGRLAITPLTDRCYITLTMALRLMLGGAPAGPAGTGKTATSKDLARAFALPCYVFNCSDQMNYQTMADIFKRLSQTGSWGCFDEFNRIPIEVLSVVATQVKSVLDAIVLYSVPAHREEQYRAAPPGTPPNVVGSFRAHGRPDHAHPHRRLLHHHEPRLRGPHGAAREPQGAVPVVRHDPARPGAHLREHADERGLQQGAPAQHQVRDAVPAVLGAAVAAAPL